MAQCCLLLLGNYLVPSAQGPSSSSNTQVTTTTTTKVLNLKGEGEFWPQRRRRRRPYRSSWSSSWSSIERITISTNHQRPAHLHNNNNNNLDRTLCVSTSKEQSRDTNKQSSLYSFLPFAFIWDQILFFSSPSVVVVCSSFIWIGRRREFQLYDDRRLPVDCYYYCVTFWSRRGYFTYVYDRIG